MVVKYSFHARIVFSNLIDFEIHSYNIIIDHHLVKHYNLAVVLIM
ncbi:unnamed protein product [Brugia pahangi]|uniref:Uncharacterized protein n=1 Tax=Brugia pahangi TaxID=6280 RepID=A0A0N4TGN5_BRUPA|nr:unnamed protein product [Brugia pahangi]